MAIAGSSTTTFGNLTINKSNGASSVNLTTGINIATVGTFTLGNVVSSSSAYMVFNAGSSVSGASDASHVNDPVKKVGSTNFTYPVGNYTYYREASTSSLSASET
jgi:hypothetical protein